MFVGRQEELSTLRDRLDIGSASFVAIRGRRRIGKSRLIREFAKDFPSQYLFTGLPPTKGITATDQRQEFINQMEMQGLPKVANDDWSHIFNVLGAVCGNGPALIALDEIAWMGSKDPNFLGKLKIAWDQYFEKNPKLILIVATSISSWLDKNLLGSTGFFGRVDSVLTLKELSIRDCVKFWGKKQELISSYEKLKVLGVTGGVPRYLKEIKPSESAESNIKRMCFSENGLLFKEFNHIFHDLFSQRSVIYKEIVELLVDHHSLSQKEICARLKRSPNRSMSAYLNDLVTAGFLSDDYAWDFKSKRLSKLRKYRLCDNYLRFYLKYIKPNIFKIENKQFSIGSLFNTMHWESVMGLQFENLVNSNYPLLIEAIGICPSDCSVHGPYFQTKTERKRGCQIDYLIQEKNTLYICEIKFSKNPVGLSVIEEVQQKIEHLSVPKLFSVRPVLVHIGGVAAEVKSSDFFDHIIDWTLLMEA